MRTVRIAVKTSPERMKKALIIQTLVATEAKSASLCWTLRVVLVIMVGGMEVPNAPDLFPTAKTVIPSQGSVTSASGQSMPTFASAIVRAADLTIQKKLRPRSHTMLQAARPTIYSSRAAPNISRIVQMQC